MSAGEYLGHLLVAGIVGASLSGCTASNAPGEAPEFDESGLRAGRAVWLANCQTCHGTGLAGAPLIGNRAAWQPRIAQGLPVLIEHAREGFQGRTGTEMPARGGNPQLDDAAVEAAVRYMVKASE